MLSKLRLFLDWGITFTEPYALEQHAQREVKYAGSKELRRKILKEYGIPPGQQIVPGQERFPERQKPGIDVYKRQQLSPSSAVGTTPSPEVKQDEGR